VTRLLVLGATGRAGSAVVTELSGISDVTVAVRSREDVPRLPGRVHAHAVRIVDIDDLYSIRAAAQRVDVIVNAIRLRAHIAPDALIRVHTRIRTASPHAHIVTVGGAGSLHLPNGRRFWEQADFPRRTLPRGIAHARLRDHLESGASGEHWTYLVPPPVFKPDGPRTGRAMSLTPSVDETEFAMTSSISYADFAVAAAREAASMTPGTFLISGG